MPLGGYNAAPMTTTIRSYVLRQGRVTDAQKRALETLGPSLTLPFSESVLDFSAVFGREAPTMMEIGFGMGEVTAAIAAAHPEWNFIAVDVFAAGVGALLKRLDEGSLDNVRVIQHDAVAVMQHMIPESSLIGLNIFFSDPWPKKRHHKRRLIQPDFIRLASSRLQPGGTLHLATDWQNYAEQMLEVLSGESALANTTQGYADRGERPLSKFEQRGQRLGHGVWDLVFRRR